VVINCVKDIVIVDGCCIWSLVSTSGDWLLVTARLELNLITSSPRKPGDLPKILQIMVKVTVSSYLYEECVYVCKKTM